MRRFFLALSLAGLGAFAAGRALFADDGSPTPAPLSDAEQARVKTLIENLGSDDFRVREAATKELLGLGEKARSALEAAKKSETPEVRFRADQLLRRLDGQRGEKRIDEGAPQGGPATGPDAPRGGSPWPGWARGGNLGGPEDLDKWMKDAEKRFRDLQEQLKRDMGQGLGQGSDLGPWAERFMNRGLGGLRSAQTFRAEGAELTVSPRGARLAVTDKAPDGSVVTSTYEGKSLDDILAVHADLAQRPGIASLAEQAKKAVADRKEAEEKAREGRGAGPRMGFTFDSQAQGVQIEMSDGHVKVTVNEPGPDGKMTTKTYEGTDLEQMKKDHPELAGKIGGIVIGGGGGAPVPFPPRALPKDGKEGKDEDGEDDGDDEGKEAAASHTGPFGLGLGAVTPAQRERLGLSGGDAGLAIVAVREGSDAAKTGLKVGDVVMSVDGTPVTASTAVAGLVRKGREAGSLSFVVLRDGKPTTLTWTR